MLHLEPVPGIDLPLGTAPEEVVSYFLCDGCEHDWHHQGRSALSFADCPRCGWGCETYETEVVDGE